MFLELNRHDRHLAPMRTYVQHVAWAPMLPESTFRRAHVGSRGKKLAKEEDIMAVVYVEARPKGRPEGSAITDYVVETEGDHVLATTSTQKEAIDWSKSNGHSPRVARVRDMNDKKKPDHWRAV